MTVIDQWIEKLCIGIDTLRGKLFVEIDDPDEDPGEPEKTPGEGLS